MSRKTKDIRTRRAPERAAGAPVRRSADFWDSRRIEIAICLALAVATLFVYAQVYNFQFINLDDDQNIYENPWVKNGLTTEGVKWAFSSAQRDYWHPLPWLSHMLDVEMFGTDPNTGRLNAGGHHVVSVLIHILNALLVFLVLRRMTGAVWRSAMVAALFAIHPLRVESVAWVTERKDVLGALFWWLATWAYLEYTRHTASWKRYALVVVLFVLALMAKPVVMTLPFFLLLLDYWPLKRFQFSLKVAGRLVLEKLPLLSLSGVFIYTTYALQRQTGATEMVGHLSFPVRLANSLVSYATYLSNAIWPYPLAEIYPYNQHLPVWQVAGSALLLAIVTALVIWKAARFPYLFVGWFWYVGVLVPVIGLVQMGFQSHADRFTYTPLIGFFVMVVWLFTDLTAGWRNQRGVAITLAAVILPALALRAKDQTSYWHDSITLFQQNITVAPDNKWALNDLGWGLSDAGRLDEAVAAFKRAIELDPTDYVKARDNLGLVLARQTKLPEAMHWFDEALKFWPNEPNFHSNRGMVLMQLGRSEEAMAEFRRALQLDLPLKLATAAQTNLGWLLFQKGQTEDAMKEYSQVLKKDPGFTLAHRNLALALERLGRDQEAIDQLKIVLKLEPNNQEAQQRINALLLKHSAAPPMKK
jgi:Flp pilus assembly protein TadD